MEDSRFDNYERRYGVRLDQVNRLGSGRDGQVLYTSDRNAVKFFDRVDGYVRERNAYLVLKAINVTRVLGHNVPRLVRVDDELRTIEMRVVTPPFFLDFASAYPEHEVPDFPPEVWEDEHVKRMEQFGENWQTVEHLCEEFRRLTGLEVTAGHRPTVAFGNLAASARTLL